MPSPAFQHVSCCLLDAHLFIWVCTAGRVRALHADTYPHKLLAQCMPADKHTWQAPIPASYRACQSSSMLASAAALSHLQAKSLKRVRWLELEMELYDRLKQRYTGRSQVASARLGEALTSNFVLLAS